MADELPPDPDTGGRPAARWRSGHEGGLLDLIGPTRPDTLPLRSIVGEQHAEACPSHGRERWDLWPPSRPHTARSRFPGSAIWAPVAAALATLFTVALSGRVWHSTGLPGVDAWMLDLLGAQSDERQLRLAAEVASGLRALTVAGILATALVAWRVLRWWSAVALALLAPAARLAAERLLKLLVARRAPGSLVFQYPSGHVAVATALILSLVLILRPAMARPRVKLSIGLSRS
jgi:hypothetical protein